MNIAFEYLYRDSGNYKNWGELVFSNKNNLSQFELENRVQSVLMDEFYFSAEKAQIPNLRFDDYIESQDHNWHEFRSVKNTTEETNDQNNRDILDFISTLRSALSV